jgi:hypothetical protein
VDSPFEWLTLEAALSDLRLSAVQRLHRTPWIEQARAKPTDFLGWLHSESTRRAKGVTRSVPFRRYRIFDDLVARNLQNRNPAFAWHDGSSMEAEFSYQALSEASAQRVAAWRAAGLTPETNLAIVRAFDRELLISVVAAMRLGIIFCWIPTEGEALIKERLANGHFTVVDVDTRYSRLVPEQYKRLNPVADVGSTSSLSGDIEAVDFTAGASVCLAFDTSSEGYATPTPVTIDQLYFCALQDGAIALELGENKRLAVLHDGYGTTRLNLVLACWMVGATYVHVGRVEDWKEAETLSNFRLDTIILSTEAVSNLTEIGVDLSMLAHLFVRDPQQSGSTIEWSDLIQRCNLGEKYFTNYIASSFLGGGVLTAPRRQGIAHDEVLPHFGQAFTLCDPVFADETSSSYGQLVLEYNGQDGPIIVDTAHMLAVVGCSHTYIECTVRGVDGQYFPCEVIERSLGHVDGTYAVCPVCVDLPHRKRKVNCDILIFADDTVPASTLSRQIKMLIERYWGRAYSRMTIQCLQTYPMMLDGEIDRNWCVEQYQLGFLQRRSKHAVFKEVDAARRMVDRALPIQPQL